MCHAVIILLKQTEVHFDRRDFLRETSVQKVLIQRLYSLSAVIYCKMNVRWSHLDFFSAHSLGTTALNHVLYILKHVK